MPDETNQPDSSSNDSVPLSEDSGQSETVTENSTVNQASSTEADISSRDSNTSNEGEKIPEQPKSNPELEAKNSEAIYLQKAKNEELIPTVDKEKILSDIENGMALWHKMASRLNLTLIILGATAVFCSLYITAFTGSCALDNIGIRFLSFISALCLTSITAFNLNSKGRGVRKGWRHMKDAVFKYKAKEIFLSDLIKASNEAEEMLGYVDFQADSMKKEKSQDESETPKNSNKN
jgi:hypothetical protein